MSEKKKILVIDVEGKLTDMPDRGLIRRIQPAGSPAPGLIWATIRDIVPFLAVDGRAMMENPPSDMALPRR